MDDNTFHRELAEVRAAHGGDRVAAVDDLLLEIVEDLNTSVVDNSQAIADVDALLGLDERSSEKTRTNGLSPQARRARPA